MSHDTWAKRYKYGGAAISLIFVMFTIFGSSFGLSLLEQSISLLSIVGVFFYIWIKHDYHSRRSKVEDLPGPDGEGNVEQNRYN